MRTVAVTNTVGSTVTREVDESLFTRASPEIGVAATKTFVSQVATLKRTEISYDHAKGFPSGERKHEPPTFVTTETAVIAFLTDATSPHDTLHNAKESRPAARQSSGSRRSTTPTLGDDIHILTTGVT